MNCERPTCRLPVIPCPDKHATGSCWYFLCPGFVHQGSGKHACADSGGDARPAQEVP
jgi:hypothetical protein